VNPGGLFCFLNVNGPRPNIYGKYLTDLFAPVTNLVLSAKVCLLVGVWGATEQLWNAFHNCSYGKFTNMESLVPKGMCKTLIVR
jgi:hypothetical protein